jgi:hypothetical protein
LSPLNVPHDVVVGPTGRRRLSKFAVEHLKGGFETPLTAQPTKSLLIVFHVPLNSQLVAAAAERPTNRYRLPNKLLLIDNARPPSVSS